MNNGSRDLEQFGRSVPDSQMAELLDRPRHAATGRRRKEFVCGPIPLEWISQAARLTGKSLAVALAAWHRYRINRKRPAKLSHATLAKFGVGRQSAARCLAMLESAGLICVQRQRGRSPVVTILELPT